MTTTAAPLAATRRRKRRAVNKNVSRRINQRTGGKYDPSQKIASKLQLPIRESKFDPPSAIARITDESSRKSVISTMASGSSAEIPAAIWRAGPSWPSPIDAVKISIRGALLGKWLSIAELKEIVEGAAPARAHASTTPRPTPCAY